MEEVSKSFKNIIEIYKEIKISKWDTDGDNMIYGMFYLKNKLNKNAWFIQRPRYFAGELEIYIVFNQNGLDIKIPNRDWFNIALVKAAFNKKRFICMPFLINIEKHEFVYGHQNVLFIDMEKKIFERFEPYGKFNAFELEFSLSEKVDQYIVEYFAKYDLKLQYKYQKDILNKGPQAIQENFSVVSQEDQNEKNSEEGYLDMFCIAWCVWFAEMRINYPDKSQDTILSELYKVYSDHIELTKFIRFYAEKIITFRNNLLEKNNFLIKDSHKYLDTFLLSDEKN
jgi:hypothetical protein